MKIVDCTSFYSEHMMYEVRLNILKDKVDKFIVTESTYSHSGKKKRLNFDINNYSKFKDKIIYIVIDKEPEGIVAENNDPSLQRSNSLKRIALSYDESLKAIKDFSDELSRNSFAPGGGSVSALLGLLGSSLTCMVSNLTYDNKKFNDVKDIHFKSSKKLQCLSSNLLLLINEDTNAYNKIIDSIRLPKKTDEQISIRNKEIYNSTLYAIETPLKVLEVCLDVHKTIFGILKHSNMNCISDIGVANHSILAGSNGALYNVIINLKDINPNKAKKYKENANYYIKQINNYYLQINSFVENELGISNDK